MNLLRLSCHVDSLPEIFAVTYTQSVVLPTSKKASNAAGLSPYPVRQWKEMVSSLYPSCTSKEYVLFFSQLFPVLFSSR